MSLVCKGQAERRINIRGGLFILTLPTACRINGHGWTMTGLAHRTIQSMVSLPVIAIKPFRLSTTITQISVKRHVNSPHWDILSKIENIKISPLDVDPNEDSGIIWGLNTHSTIWTTTGILILVTGIILMIVMSFQKYRRTPRRRRPVERSRDPGCVPGCTFELLDRYDDSERRASTGGILTVRDVQAQEGSSQCETCKHRRDPHSARRASTGGIPTVRDVAGKLRKPTCARKEQSRPPSPDSDIRSRLDIVFRQDSEQWVRAATARAGQ